MLYYNLYLHPLPRVCLDCKPTIVIDSYSRCKMIDVTNLYSIPLIDVTHLYSIPYTFI